MKRIIVGVAILTGLLIVVAFLFRIHEIPNPDHWTSETRRLYNPFIGVIKIVDAQSGETLFFHSDDPLVYPEKIEKLSDDGT